jgi:hypothetical protein
MTKKVVLAVLFICTAFTASAIKKKGYFINNQGDTNFVVFRIPAGLFSRTPAYEKLQWKIVYLDSCKKHHTLKPGQVKEYCFNYKSEQIRMVSIKNSFNASLSGFKTDQDIFLRLVIDGQLRYNP